MSHRNMEIADCPLSVEAKLIEEFAARFALDVLIQALILVQASIHLFRRDRAIWNKINDRYYDGFRSRHYYPIIINCAKMIANRLCIRRSLCRRRAPVRQAPVDDDLQSQQTNQFARTGSRWPNHTACREFFARLTSLPNHVIVRPGNIILFRRASLSSASRHWYYASLRRCRNSVPRPNC